MDVFFAYAPLIAAGAVFLVLVAGIVNMYRTNPKAASTSNRLMRWRVILQFIAVVLLMAGLWWRTQRGG